MTSKLILRELGIWIQSICLSTFQLYNSSFSEFLVSRSLGKALKSIMPSAMVQLIWLASSLRFDDMMLFVCLTFIEGLDFWYTSHVLMALSVLISAVLERMKLGKTI